MNVLARLLLCKQVGWDLISILNYASNLCFLLEGEGKETAAPLRATGVKGTKKGEIGEFGTLVYFSGLERGKWRKRRRLDTRRA